MNDAIRGRPFDFAFGYASFDFACGYAQDRCSGSEVEERSGQALRLQARGALRSGQA